MANKSYENYIETTDFPDNTHIQISVYYSKCGTSASRGFYLNVTPVKKEGGIISMVLFSGLSRFLLPAKRYSEKQLNIAVEKSKAFEQELIEELKKRNKSA